jgi:hypothetical protein
MIYERVDIGRPIKQGDIFRHVPRVDLSLAAIPVVEDEGTHEARWLDIPQNSEITAILTVKSVTGIVITQNCDAQRGEYLCLAQIDPFIHVIGHNAPPKNADKWQSLIIQQARTNSRLFYLPADRSLGFNEPMVVDFRIIIRVPRHDVEDLRSERCGTLNATANDHFRETLAHFFRRYAYNEWYPLAKDQFEAYADRCGEPVEPFPWQR